MRRRLNTQVDLGALLHVQRRSYPENTDIAKPTAVPIWIASLPTAPRFQGGRWDPSAPSALIPTNREIAGSFGVSLITVKTQVRSVLRKLVALDRVSAVRTARGSSLVD